MAKVQKVATPATTVTVEAFFASIAGVKGKPSRPEGMDNQTWWKCVATMRVPKALKALQGVARLATLEGGEYTQEQCDRILSDVLAAYRAIKAALPLYAGKKAPAKDDKKRTVKGARNLYFA